MHEGSALLLSYDYIQIENLMDSESWCSGSVVKEGASQVKRREIESDRKQIRFVEVSEM